VCVCVQPYDQVAVTEITLANTGRVGFDFFGVGMDPCFESSLKPGIAVMMPHIVSIIFLVRLRYCIRSLVFFHVSL